MSCCKQTSACQRLLPNCGPFAQFSCPGGIPGWTLWVSASWTSLIDPTIQYTSIQAAINYANANAGNSVQPWQILIHTGVYNENITMFDNISLIGTGNENDVKIFGTFDYDDTNSNTSNICLENLSFHNNPFNIFLLNILGRANVKNVFMKNIIINGMVIIVLSVVDHMMNENIKTSTNISTIGGSQTWSNFSIGGTLNASTNSNTTLSTFSQGRASNINSTTVSTRPMAFDSVTTPGNLNVTVNSDGGTYLNACWIGGITTVFANAKLVGTGGSFLGTNPVFNGSANIVGCKYNGSYSGSGVVDPGILHFVSDHSSNMSVGVTFPVPMSNTGYAVAITQSGSASSFDAVRYHTPTVNGYTVVSDASGSGIAYTHTVTRVTSSIN